MRNQLDIQITLVTAIFLTFAMLWPLERPASAPEGGDKLIHLIAFAILAFPLARTSRFGLLPVFIGTCCFGAVIEMIQPSFGRHADFSDWLADILGVAVGVLLGATYNRIKS